MSSSVLLATCKSLRRFHSFALQSARASGIFISSPRNLQESRTIPFVLLAISKSLGLFHTFASQSARASDTLVPNSRNLRRLRTNSSVSMHRRRAASFVIRLLVHIQLPISLHVLFLFFVSSFERKRRRAPLNNQQETGGLALPS